MLRERLLANSVGGLLFVTLFACGDALADTNQCEKRTDLPPTVNFRIDNDCSTSKTRATAMVCNSPWYRRTWWTTPTIPACRGWCAGSIAG